jgi:hypothetical protein
MAMPAVTVAACALSWFIGRPWRAPDGRRRALQIAGMQAPFLLAAAVGVYYQFVKGQTILDHPYMAAFIIGPMVLALGSVLHALEAGFGRVSPALIVGAAILFLLLPLPLLSESRRFWLISAVVSCSRLLSAWPILLFIGLNLAAVVYLAVFRRCAHAVFVALALLGLSNGLDRHSSQSLHRDCFDFAIEADRFATPLDPTLRDIRYWYDEKERAEIGGQPYPMAYMFHSYVATRGWQDNLFGGAPIPRLAEIGPQHLGAFHRVAVLSATPAHAAYSQGLAVRFREMGGGLRVQTQRRFRHGDLDVTMTVYWIDPPPAAPKRVQKEAQ